MDSKTVRLAVVMALTAVVLIVLAVYAVNADRIKARLSPREETPDAADTGESADAGDDTYIQVVDGNFRAFGEQIGNQTKAFLYDEGFFDPMQDIAVISDGDEEMLTLGAAVLGDSIHVTVTNPRGGIETDTAFQVSVSGPTLSEEKTWTDTDRDGQIDVPITGVGTYRIRMLEISGYRTPSDTCFVKVEKPENGLVSYMQVN
ncbi:MAG: hypothetical protein K6C95_06880 [Lachnospiraceae bacterium]|nr:hypothetical protein [Lachnospiraceae bacterium]